MPGDGTGAQRVRSAIAAAPPDLDNGAEWVADPGYLPHFTADAQDVTVAGAGRRGRR
jgi:hypothetical protein